MDLRKNYLKLQKEINNLKQQDFYLIFYHQIILTKHKGKNTNN